MYSFLLTLTVLHCQNASSIYVSVFNSFLIKLVSRLRSLRFGAPTPVGALFVLKGEKMNLYEKPLYALRNLGLRLGLPSITKYKKNELIKKIMERVKEIEKGIPIPPKSTRGRPNLTSCYITVETDENGKIVFSETSAPEVEKVEKEVISDVLPKPEVKSKKEKERSIKTLKETKKTLSLIIEAIDCYIETLKY